MKPCTISEDHVRIRTLILPTQAMEEWACEFDEVNAPAGFDKSFLKSKYYLYQRLEKMIKSLQLFLLLLLISPIPESVLAQPDTIQSFGQMALVNRMDSTRVKVIRTDKPIKIRMTDGRRLEGTWYLADEQTMVVGKQAIPMKDIYNIAGYVTSDSKHKTLGAGLVILSAVAAVYPAYLIFSGFALGQPQALFVGSTVIFLDLFLAYAGTTLMGIYPRRFNRLNWDIRIDYPTHSIYKLPGELPLIITD